MGAITGARLNIFEEVLVTYSRHQTKTAPDVLRKMTKTSTGVTAQNRTDHLSNTGVEHYRYANLVVNKRHII
jgi:hypothetical protein